MSQLVADACETLKGIGRDAGVAKLLPKRTRVLVLDLAMLMSKQCVKKMAEGKGCESSAGSAVSVNTEPDV